MKNEKSIRMTLWGLLRVRVDVSAFVWGLVVMEMKRARGQHRAAAAM
jgi:hypothetical protein